jgi:uncharacterized protein (DUF885 family)
MYTDHEPSSEIAGRLVHDFWRYILREEPERATEAGATPEERVWTDLSPEGFGRRSGLIRDLAVQAAAASSSVMSEGQELDLALLRWELERREIRASLPSSMFLLDQMNGVHLRLLNTLRDQTLFDGNDVELYVDRIAKFPKLAEEALALAEADRATGTFTTPATALRLAADQIRSILSIPPDASEVVTRVAASGHCTRSQLRMIRNRVPGMYSALDNILTWTTSVLSRGDCPDSGLASFSDGPLWYEQLVRYVTSIDVTCAFLHDQGRQLLEQSTPILKELLSSLGVAPDLPPEPLQSALSSPPFVFTDALSMLDKFREKFQGVVAAVPRLFQDEPTTGLELSAMPAHLALGGPAAYYAPCGKDAGRPGRVQINVLEPPTRPLWGVLPLLLHEGTPGHHLQFAIAQDVNALPDFRRYADHDVFVEGWALYAETLADALGVIEDDLDALGLILYWRLRAARLVVDTGVHHLGWDRTTAVAFLRAAALSSNAEIEAEVDRYFTWPGQALGYMTGSLEILDLRDRWSAQNRPIRDFHSRVLGNGAVSLPVLRQAMHPLADHPGGDAAESP